MQGEKLLEVLRKTGKPNVNDLVDLVYGEVVSEDPLQIKVDNRFIVDESFLILSVLCQRVSWWEGLKAGDRVRMLRVNQGQLFYVMEKEGGLLG